MSASGYDFDFPSQRVNLWIDESQSADEDAIAASELVQFANGAPMSPDSVLLDMDISGIEVDTQPMSQDGPPSSPVTPARLTVPVNAPALRRRAAEVWPGHWEARLPVFTDLAPPVIDQPRPKRQLSFDEDHKDDDVQITAVVSYATCHFCGCSYAIHDIL